LTSVPSPGADDLAGVLSWALAHLDEPLRVEDRLLERGEDTVGAIATRAGLGSPDTLRRHLTRTRGVTPDAYRRTFRLDAGD
jgi:transcriptional regulator GlxA family with amidase domain